MRCRKCGGVMHHYLTDLDGETYYQCHDQLTAFNKDGTRVGQFIPCETIQDKLGSIFTGIISFIRGSHITSIRVKAGVVVM